MIEGRKNHELRIKMLFPASLQKVPAKSRTVFRQSRRQAWKFLRLQGQDREFLLRKDVTQNLFRLNEKRLRRTLNFQQERIYPRWYAT